MQIDKKDLQISKKNLQINSEICKKHYLYKIEGHSNHQQNDKADTLARMGTGQERIFKLNLTKII